ncbi:permease [Tissierella praeacuta]|uniref:permease n=1 Tax=Tissierella praeacuta TaxID=43131 RepID=UPI001C124CFF|nr:permease [Tissierella praeacuta]MBU5255349.1 permease [Tissierella praeacuta]
MTIPAYIVTGFLDAGKTMFLNNLLNRYDGHQSKILVIQFETGEEDFHSRYNNCDSIVFPKKLLEQQPKYIIDQIHSRIQSYEFDEIWIEWNGVAPFSQLQSLLLHSSLHRLCKIERVIHIADAVQIESLLGRTGNALPEQILNSDFVVVRNVHSKNAFRRVQRLMNGINSDANIYKMSEYKKIYNELSSKKSQPIEEFLLMLILVVGLSFSGRLVLELFQIPINTIINVFLGVILQAIPFLLIGVLLSSLIQVFIPKEAVERRFPKSFGMGMLVAILGGFCLPVCDCASIPIFRSLVKKGVPIPVAVTFMTATPVINPVVILSTYYAFNGNLSIVIGRVCFGVIGAILIGIIFAVWMPKGDILTDGSLGRFMCNCGCYEETELITNFMGKVNLFLRHSQAEFFSVGKYLIIGTFISSIFQTIGTEIFTAAQSGASLAISIIIMMVMAFLLSLCSSSDAVVARSFAKQFPMGAIMGFLVFGPMMDIKNVMMLSSGFSNRFIGKLLFVTFIVCFAIIFLFFGLGGI